MSESAFKGAEARYDDTWPDPLPTNGQLRDVFFNQLSASASYSSEAHLNHIKPLFYEGASYEGVTRDLHKLLTVQGYRNKVDLSGRQTVRGLSDFQPFVKHVGIDSRDDVRKGILVAMRPLFAEIITGDEDTQDKLDTLAASLGIIAAESHSFSAGNTRVARSLHDYIRGGLDSLDMDRVGDVTRHFTPPVATEELIMMKNLTYLMDRSGNPAIGKGVVEVKDGVVESYLQAEEYLTHIWKYVSDGEEGRDMDDDAEDRRVLKAQIDAILGDGDPIVRSTARSVLMQKKYAPAALAAAFQGRSLPKKLDEWDMAHLIATNNELMKMRVLSLGVGMARKGMFMAVERPDTETRPYVVNRPWYPSNI